MTHMHIPDGILPAWLWITGFGLMTVFLAISLLRLRAMDRRKNIPLLGAIAAAMLVAMNIPELVLPYHLNLSVAAGILLGPALGFLAAFIVNLMLALMGHGGITVMGLNTILLGAEAVLGHTLFFLLPARMPVFWRTAAATVTSLLLVSLLLIGMVGVSRIESGTFVLPAEHGRGTGSETAGTIPPSARTFAVMVLSLGAVGWCLESLITGAAIKFVSRVKPDLIAHALHKRSGPRNAAGSGS